MRTLQGLVIHNSKYGVNQRQAGLKRFIIISTT